MGDCLRESLVSSSLLDHYLHSHFINYIVCEQEQVIFQLFTQTKHSYLFQLEILSPTS